LALQPFLCDFCGDYVENLFINLGGRLQSEDCDFLPKKTCIFAVGKIVV